MAKKSKALKPETDDPVAALSEKSIHVRCAAARDFSQFGTTEHLAVLVTASHSDSAPSVRLGCAAAASDILSRCRLPPASEALSSEDRRALLELFRGFDPAVNSGLFPILACLGLPELLTRISAGLRDPRGDVRLGGAVGLLRFVSSAAVAGDDLIEARVVMLLSDRRLKPDALAAVAQVCAAVNYTTALSALHALDLPGTHGEAVAAALETFEKLTVSLSGGWYSDGRDAGEVNPNSPQGESFSIVDEEGAVVLAPDGTWSWVEGFGGDSIRRLYIRKVGEPTAGPAFQRDQRTWYMAGTDRLKSLLEEQAASHTIDWAATRRGEGESVLKIVAKKIRPLLSEAGSLWRDLALLLAAGGDYDGALEALNASLDGKRTPPDTWFHLGEARAAAGDAAGAAEAWQTCLDKARSKKADYVMLSRQRLGQ
ncbi:MAG: hypothetical protein P8R54_02405 [Myxococcota bacterium]|nr:hypothetical protein [Myxococcota bacterium]